jgi:uncharacterized protein (TIGR00375 family)
MPFIADLHIHSKYSLATSKEMNVPTLAKWAKIKGIALLGTGDFTHGLWISELEKDLKPAGQGIYSNDGVYFILTAEVSNIYKKDGKTRKVHNLIFAPSFKTAREINKAFSGYGKLESNGRPILKLDCEEMAKKLFAIDPRVMIIPAHAWTPHFSVLGSNSGFGSVEECFGSQAPNIFSIETGLSSDPAMNWRSSKLDRFCLISNSDSHSPAKIGREANVFKEKIDYNGLCDILKDKDSSRFLYTIEFFPEEGKYHWDGHRGCDVSLSPKEAIKNKNICPACGKKLTMGVAHRVEELADREEGFVEKNSPPFKRAVPLAEIIAGALGKRETSLAVTKEYADLVKKLGSEFRILIDMPEGELKKYCPEKILKGIMNVRLGNIMIKPGHDGEYGKVEIFG